jgi:hypothetical protein
MTKQIKTRAGDRAATDLKSNARRLYSALWAPVLFAMVASGVIIYNNSYPLTILYLALMFLGIVVITMWGTLPGGYVGLVLISAWVAEKLLRGAWTMSGLAYNLVELVSIALTFIASVLYHQQIIAILNIFTENQRRIKNLDLEDRAVGLIKSTVGMLRLKEEEERSTRYQRPFSLILIQVRPVPGVEWEAGDSVGLVRTLANTVKAKTRDVDIPFLLSPDRIALILPETEAPGTRKVVNNIVSSMMNAQYVPQSGKAESMWKRAQIRFGFSAFLGKSNTVINMLEAAERSLVQNTKTNPGDLYQNVFIEWETVGEAARPPQELTSKETEGKVVVPLDAPIAAAPDKNDKKSMILRAIDRLRSL